MTHTLPGPLSDTTTTAPDGRRRRQRRQLCRHRGRGALRRRRRGRQPAGGGQQRRRSCSCCRRSSHVGRYLLKHQLGSGGLGAVYAALDPLLSRQVAVKMLHVAELDTAAARRARVATAGRGARRRRPRAPATSSPCTTPASRPRACTSPWSGCKARTCASCWPTAGGPTRCRPRASPSAWPTRWPMRMAKASCIATSSRPTSSWSAARSPRCSTSASPA